MLQWCSHILHGYYSARLSSRRPIKLIICVCFQVLTRICALSAVKYFNSDKLTNFWFLSLNHRPSRASRLKLEIINGWLLANWVSKIPEKQTRQWRTNARCQQRIKEMCSAISVWLQSVGHVGAGTNLQPDKSVTVWLFHRESGLFSRVLSSEDQLGNSCKKSKLLLTRVVCLFYWI